MNVKVAEWSLEAFPVSPAASFPQVLFDSLQATYEAIFQQELAAYQPCAGHWKSGMLPAANQLAHENEAVDARLLLNTS